MKKLTSVAMALALAGLASSAFADENNDAGGLKNQTTVRFTGVVTAPTCSFSNPSQTVNMPDASEENFKDVSVGNAANNVQTKEFHLAINCAEGFSGDRMKMQITGDAKDNILKNTNGSATGVGLKILNGSGTPLALNTELSNQTAGIENAFRNKTNDLPLKAQYVRGDDELSGGTLDTSAVFEIYYK
ncbi:fimbrial protein [Lelliottia sp. WAP21]|uniref:fimbrial protein n=1 Tax=Lelliottia sp. WAP21 TaxID=2877426 RepID=UPI001E51561C|nr:fimbrial protein [Lelliottia sp. WAP21]